MLGPLCGPRLACVCAKSVIPAALSAAGVLLVAVGGATVLYRQVRLAGASVGATQGWWACRPLLPGAGRQSMPALPLPIEAEAAAVPSLPCPCCPQPETRYFLKRAMAYRTFAASQAGLVDSLAGELPSSTSHAEQQCATPRRPARLPPLCNQLPACHAIAQTGCGPAAAAPNQLPACPCVLVLRVPSNPCPHRVWSGAEPRGGERAASGGPRPLCRHARGKCSCWLRAAPRAAARRAGSAGAGQAWLGCPSQSSCAAVV